LVLLVIPLVPFASTGDITAEKRRMLEKFSLKYIENTTVTFKNNIAVGEISSPEWDKDMFGITEVLRDLSSEVCPESGGPSLRFHPWPGIS
jgi:hypothetical protein